MLIFTFQPSSVRCITFRYFDRSGSVGLRYASLLTASFRVMSLLLYQSMSWRGSPERWVTRSRGTW